MIDENQMAEAFESRAIRREGRRAFFKAAIGAAAVGAGGLAVASAVQAAAAAPSETDVLNFLLNLEYLEANFYALATTGNPIDASFIGAAGVAVAPRAPVPFGTDKMLAATALEIAEDELAHVNFLRAQLKTAAVAQPMLDLGVTPLATNAFSRIAQKAGVVADGVIFDPYSSTGNFLLGAFLFEDVIATAYRGALPLLTTQAYIDAAMGIMSVEAQHAAAIRTQLYVRGITTGKYIPLDATQAVNVVNAKLISDARDVLDGATDDDQGITGIAADGTPTTDSNVALLDADGLGLSRTAGQVLNIVYLNDGVATSGGFFPKGMNGKINSSTAAA